MDYFENIKDKLAASSESVAVNWLDEHTNQVYGLSKERPQQRTERPWRHSPDGFPNPTCAQLALDILEYHNKPLTKENIRRTTQNCLAIRYPWLPSHKRRD